MGDLPAYAKAEGSDIEQFENFDQEAHMGGMSWRCWEKGLSALEGQRRGLKADAEFRPAPRFRNAPASGIPAEDMIPKWDVMYFIEAMGNNAFGTIYPDLERATPYVVVPLQR